MITDITYFILESNDIKVDDFLAKLKNWLQGGDKFNSLSQDEKFALSLDIMSRKYGYVGKAYRAHENDNMFDSKRGLKSYASNLEGICTYLDSKKLGGSINVNGKVYIYEDSIRGFNVAEFLESDEKYWEYIDIVEYYIDCAEVIAKPNRPVLKYTAELYDGDDKNHQAFKITDVNSNIETIVYSKTFNYN